MSNQYLSQSTSPPTSPDHLNESLTQLPTLEKLSEVYPPEVLEPKIFAEYNPAPGKVARRVYIDRAKQRYASFDIEDLLKQFGIDYSQPLDPNDLSSYLPLENFDNSDFDSRTSVDWINLGLNVDPGIQSLLKNDESRKRKEQKEERRRKLRQRKQRINIEDNQAVLDDEELSPSSEDVLLHTLCDDPANGQDNTQTDGNSRKRCISELNIFELTDDLQPGSTAENADPHSTQPPQNTASDVIGMDSIDATHHAELDADERLLLGEIDPTLPSPMDPSILLINDPDAIAAAKSAAARRREGKMALKKAIHNDEPQYLFTPYIPAPKPIPARAARFWSDGTARWEFCEVLALVRTKEVDREANQMMEGEDDEETDGPSDQNGPQKKTRFDENGLPVPTFRSVLTELRTTQLRPPSFQQRRVAEQQRHAFQTFVREEFEVRWSDNKISRLPRIHILFYAEDPERFAMRVLWAHRKRKETALRVQYNLYIESMPTRDIAFPDTWNAVYSKIVPTGDTTTDTTADGTQAVSLPLRTATKLRLASRGTPGMTGVLGRQSDAPTSFTRLVGPIPARQKQLNALLQRSSADSRRTLGTSATLSFLVQQTKEEQTNTSLPTGTSNNTTQGEGASPEQLVDGRFADDDLFPQSSAAAAEGAEGEDAIASTAPTYETPDQRAYKLKQVVPDELRKQLEQLHKLSVNRLIFDSVRSDPAQARLFEDLELPPVQPPPSAPEQGTILTPPHEMREARTQLEGRMLVTHPAITDALRHVWTECGSLAEVHLYAVRELRGQTITPEEFTQREQQQSHTVVSFLNETWMTSLHESVMRALQAVGPAWFGMTAETLEAYDRSKLRRFFQTVTFMMEDSLRLMLERSIEEYTAFIERQIPSAVVVRGISDVTITQQRHPLRRRTARLLIQLKQQLEADADEVFMAAEKQLEDSNQPIADTHTEYITAAELESIFGPEWYECIKPSKETEKKAEEKKDGKADVKSTGAVSPKSTESKPADTPAEELPSEVPLTFDLLLRIAQASPKTPIPLLHVEVDWSAQQGGVTTSTSVEELKTLPVRLFMAAIESCQEFPPLPHQLLPSLFKARKNQQLSVLSPTPTPLTQLETEGTPTEGESSTSDATTLAHTTAAEGATDGSAEGAQIQTAAQRQAAQQNERKAAEAARETARANHMYLNTLHPSDEYVISRKERLERAMEKAITPLQDYLATFSQLSEILSIDPKTFAAQKCTDNISPAVVSDWVKDYRQKADAVDTQIPDSMNLGLVLVSCTNIKEMLRQKYSNIAAALIAALGRRVMTQADTLIEKYEAILQKMTERPRSPEELVAKREFLATIPRELKQLQPELDAMKETYDTLESFDHVFSDEEFQKHWSGYGWSKKILSACEQTSKNLDGYQKVFEEQLLANQQQLSRQLTEVTIKVANLTRFSDFSQVSDVYQEVKRLSAQIDDMKRRQKEFSTNEGLLGREVTEYPELNVTAKKFEGYNLLWGTAESWSHWRVDWPAEEFLDFDAVQKEADLTKAISNMQRCTKLFREQPEPLGVAQLVKSQMEELAPRMPLLVALRNPGMKPRHWKQIQEELGFDIEPQPGTTVSDVLKLDLGDHEEAVKRICDVAAKEFALEEALEEMTNEWQPIKFDMHPYKDTNTYVMFGAAELQEKLDMHLLRTQAMSFSPFKEPHKEAIENWLNLLQRVSLVIEEWLKCQKRWIYLQPIFSSEDIQRQLPIEYKRFQGVDRTWKRLMNQAQSNPSVLEFCQPENLLNTFREMFNILESVANGLESYLETKRKAFPRFYFLSSDELLDILSQTKDPTRVQPYLSTCFEAIKSVTFQSDMQITAMTSKEKETINFVEGIYPEGNVEQWLKEVESCMFIAVRDQIIQSLEDYPKRPRKEWTTRWPGQVVLAVGQIYWTREVEESIEKGQYKQVDVLLTKLKDQLNDLTDLVRGNLTSLQRKTLGALITIDVHARDVTDRLVQNKVQAVTDFDWISQFRYYWEDDDVHVKMMQTDFLYQYEYLGNTSRLVITPLTDKLYMTLMGAINLHLGGAPAGPAGTGKTETTKDLAKAVAVKCVVFNCSESLKVNAMGKFFKGLSMTGAWSCFDEFNRIDIEVLSVIAQQIATIQNAIMDGVDHFIFEDDDIPLVPTLSIFITMNPGYAGRSELPDNLKALFRPVAVMIPDYALIAEIRLFSFGFKDGNALSKKMVATFKLSSEQLSSQDHYDFGMRAVNTVISAAGNLKHEFPDVSEELLLLRAVRDTNIPKFLAEDIPLFKGIVSDLFPGVEPMVVDYGQLQTSIVEQTTLHGLQANEMFITKCLQLYETTVLRHGLMLVGPTGGGKSCCLTVLSEAMTALKKKGVEGYETVIMHKLNPKSIPYGDLYGTYDAATNDWKNGILTLIMRECVRDESPTKHWIICDGPVDAVWIEDMNTVLDDSKKLCLASGEVIPLTPSMNMIFEVEDLRVASPATVSRCGMVYLEPSTNVPHTARIYQWLQSMKPLFEQNLPQLQKLCDTFIPAALEFKRHNCPETIPTVEANICMALFNMLEAQFTPFLPDTNQGETVPTQEKLEYMSQTLLHIFVFSLIWSFGATTNTEGRKKFNSHIMEQLRTNFPSSLAPPLPAESVTSAQPPKNSIPPSELIPTSYTLYDYVYDVKTKQWTPWMDTVEDYVIKPRTPFTEMIVPTVDSVRNTKVIDLLVRKSKHVLAIGSTGTGKTVTVNQYLFKQAPSEYIPIPMTFSAQTSATATQRQLDDKFERRRSGIVGAPPGNKFVIFVDDLNMPKLEIYGAQPPIELLRQFVDHGGWYVKKDSTSIPFFKIEDVQLVGAMGPPGGGRNPVTNRFLRHFNHIFFTDLEESSEQQIFSTILSSFFQSFPDNIKALTMPMVSATIEVYHTITRELLPTPSKSHYTFNLRDLSKVFQGVLSGDPKSLQDTAQMLRLWLHETTRVFADRLVTSTKDIHDREWFQDLLRRQLKKHFSVTWEGIGASDAMMFGDLLATSSDIRPYQQITDMERLKKVLDDALEDYRDAQKGGQLELVLFQNAIQHLARIARIIRQPYGNALLLGVGGSGRQSLTRLAAHIAEFNLRNVEIKKGFNRFEWHKCLKDIMKGAGMDAQPTVFLFSDTQLINESFLEDINNMLNSGDVPNIWDPNEMETIYSTMRPIAQSLGIIPTKINLFSHFVKRIRENMHIVLCMSPFGDAFRNRLRMFPSLVTCCTIDWFDPWPDEALRAVARVKLDDVDLELKQVTVEEPAPDEGEGEGEGEAEEGEGEGEENKSKEPPPQKMIQRELPAQELSDKVIEMCVFIHQSVERANTRFLKDLKRTNHVTPLSYLEMLSTVRTLLKRKREELKVLKLRLSGGVEKIQKATEEVVRNEEQLKRVQPQLEKKTGEVKEMMKQIKSDQDAANEKREVVKKEEAEASEQATKCAAMKEEAETLLNQALPVLHNAEKALDALSSTDIQEVAGYKAPGEGVRLVFATLCIVMNEPPQRIPDPDHPNQKKDDYMGPAKSLFLKPRDLVFNMKQYPKENIPPKIIQKLEPYIQNPEFVPQKISKASKACTSICLWIRALYQFYFTYQDIKPKQELVAKTEKELQEVREMLKAKQEELAQLEASIRILEEKYQAAVEQQESLKNQVQSCITQRDRAYRLTAGLGGECTRWTKEMHEIEHLEYNVIGDVLISAGTIVYLGPFTSQFRSDLLTEWKNRLTSLDFPFSPNASIQVTLADSVRVRQWGLEGLPSDNLSIENGLILHNARRWPLMIDPQGQANKWIRRMEKGNLDVVKQTEDTFMRTLETAIRFGRPVLIESVGEELDPALEPVLTRSTFIHKGSEVMKLGDTLLPYNNSFKLYMTTKLPNPRYAPETNVKVTLLNFTVTPTGLEDQLLANVVVQERPDLEESKNLLAQNNAKMRAKLKETEDLILKQLAETANPLEDEKLIDTLSESKKTSTSIEIQVKDAEVNERLIDQTRNTYKPMAIRGSILFFCVADLASIDPMYQNSLQWFMDLYKQAIEDTEPAQDFEVRLASLMDNFTYLLYQNVCRSLFARHKLLFSFLMITRILSHEGKIDPSEYAFLIGRSTVDDPHPNPAPEWLTSRSWTDIEALSKLPAFAGFSDAVAANPDSWKVIFDSSQAHREPLPGRFNTLNQFQKLLVLKCLRADKMTEGVQDFVQEQFGKKYVQPPNFNLPKSYRDSNSMRPLIFIISPGTNPVKDLEGFAQEMRMTKKLYSLSLGQGQGVKAEQYITEAVENGFWVLLQNCDLYTSWMPELERIVENWKPENVHRDFRLWLTSQPSEKFPVSILQSGIKMTNEPPKGLQANLLRTYESMDPAELLPVGEYHDVSVLRRLLFSLTFFHAVIQERRKFGPLGWNIRYAFTVDDLNVCIKQLRLFLETSVEVPYRVLSYLFGEINYGGRVTDFLDRRLLTTLLETFINPGVLEDGYAFSPSGKYTSVDLPDIKSYIQHINTFDLNAHPEVFGLHENADITCAMQDTSDLFDNLLSLQPTTSGSASGQSREEIIEEKVNQISEKVPHVFNLESVSKKFPTLYEESMNTVLVQECIRYNRLLQTIHTSLEDIVKALAGKVVMSQALEEMGTSLFNNQIPKLWEKPAYPSLKPLSVWVEDLVSRCNFLQDWIDNGIPNVYWISGLFFPQAFLTGTLQNFARKYQIPIDHITFDAVIHDEYKSPKEVMQKPKDGCYIYGLFLEGARWDTEQHVLAESRPKELYTQFPIIHLNPVEDRIPPTTGSYSCPIYKILTRQGTLSTTGHSTNYVTSLDIPSDTEEGHWIKRSVALFCALDY